MYFSVVIEKQNDFSFVVESWFLSAFLSQKIYVDHVSKFRFVECKMGQSKRHYALA